MGDNLAALPRVNAGMILAAFLLLAQPINLPTECLGDDLALNGRQPIGDPHEGRTSTVHRHSLGADASHSIAFGHLESDWRPDPRGEPRRISENAPIQQRPVRAEELMNSILNWLVAKFDLPAIQEVPRIEFVQPAAMAQLRYRGSAAPQAMPLDGGRDVVAVYDDAKRTIYMPQGWTGVTSAEQSVLVHEMVHHLQNLGKLKYECPEAREKLAFAAQEQWLELVDRTLASEFGLDPFTLLVRTSCLG